MSFHHQHGLGLPSEPPHTPPPHSMSRASSVSILEVEQKGVESWTCTGQQWLRGMGLLGRTPDMDTKPPPSLPDAVSQGLLRGSPKCLSPKPWKTGAQLACGQHLRLQLHLGYLGRRETAGLRLVEVPGVRGRIPGPEPVVSILSNCKCLVSSLSDVLLWRAARGCPR